MRKRCMKTVLSVLVALALCLSVVSFVGCFGAEETFEVVSAKFVQDEADVDYVYVESEQETSGDTRYLKYKVELTFKSSEGREVKGETVVEQGDSAIAVSADGVEEVLYLNVEMIGFDNSEVGENKELTLKFNGVSGLVGGGECELKTSYDVVHVVTDCKLNEENKGLSYLKKEYAKGEEFDASAIKVDLTYGDGTSETLGLDKVMEMKQMEGTSVSGFDSSKCGYGKNLSVNLKYPNGSASTTLYYTVTPPAEWTKETAVGYGQYSFYYHKTSDMTVGEEIRKGVKVLTVSFGNVKLYAVQGGGIISNPTASMIEKEMNKVLSGSQVNLFNLFIPDKHKAAVTDLTKLTESSLKAVYSLKDASGAVVSENVMYDVYSTAGSRQINITVENIDKASESELEKLEEFVSFVWFK